MRIGVLLQLEIQSVMENLSVTDMSFENKINNQLTSWINNKVLLHSTGHYIQYPMINHNGKEYEKEYICITEPLCCTAEINTTS